MNPMDPLIEYCIRVLLEDAVGVHVTPEGELYIQLSTDTNEFYSLKELAYKYAEDLWHKPVAGKYKN